MMMNDDDDDVFLPSMVKISEVGGNDKNDVYLTKKSQLTTQFNQFNCQKFYSHSFLRNHSSAKCHQIDPDSKDKYTKMSSKSFSVVIHSVPSCIKIRVTAIQAL